MPDEPKSDAPVQNEYPSFEPPVSDTPTTSNSEPTPVPTATPVFFTAPSPESAAPGEAPVSVSAFEPKKKMKKPVFIGSIVAVIAAVLIGGSTLAYNFWYQNPDKVVTDAIINALTSNTISATGSADIEDDETKMKLEVSGKTDQNVHGSVAVKLDVTSKEDNKTIAVSGEGVFGDNGDLYVKVNDVQKLLNTYTEQSGGMVDFAIFDDVIKKIDGNWIKISGKDLGEVNESYGKAQECLAGIVKSLNDDKAFYNSTKDEISKLYKEHRFLTVGDKIGSRTINDQGSLGYVLTGDEKVADEFFTGLADTQIGKKAIACDDSIAFDKIITPSTDKNEGTTTTAEIWVSRFEHSITELRLKGEGDTTGLIVVNPIFNKNETVTIPTDTISLSELKTDIENAYSKYYQSVLESYSMQPSSASSQTLFN